MKEPNHKKKEKQELANAFLEEISEGSMPMLSLEQCELLLEIFVENAHEEGLNHLEEVLMEQFPFSEEAQLMLVEIKSFMLQYDDALSILDQRLMMSPTNADLLTAKGEILIITEKYEQAEDALQQALLYHHEPAEIHYNLGLVAQATQKPEIAIENFNKALEIDPNLENVWLDLGYNLEMVDRPEEAMRCYEHYLDLDPFSATAWFNLGVVCCKLDHLDKAVNAYDFAITLEDDFASAHFNLGNVYMNLEKFDKAIRCYEKVLELEGSSGETYCYLGAAYEHQGLTREASRHYKKSVSFDKNYDDGWFGLASCCIKTDRPSEAKHFIEKAIALTEDKPVYWMIAAEAERMLNNWEKAELCFERARSIGGINEELYVHWSMMYYQRNDFSKAFEKVSEGMQILEKNARLHYIAAAYLLLGHQYDEAIDYLKTALSLDQEKFDALLDFFPSRKTQKALFEFINQYRKDQIE
ncbi:MULTISPECIES: tetratricopeptide repeat protein [Persicobacter]|uniref:Tetratricopeptide repeat protein n=1 Tax=Persicobacter diffluens TaxID=981 RepID=A0AAN4W0A7_9BACT|nr:tetratricopeptide repeat protein [Persicobacter sp. CCB-QB2]GJM62115.1 hypothetical protein PEDI_26670 [Persicobacter diffluens]